MLRVMKPGRRYFIINIDEPYAKAIYEILKRGEIAKGEGNWPEGDISFEEWKKLTFVKQMNHLRETFLKKGGASGKDRICGNSRKNREAV